MTEEYLHQAVFFLVRLVEAAAALVIFGGAAFGFFRFLSALVRQDTELFTRLRLDMGRYLVLGLEFQLASDLLRTVVAPTFEDIGKLAAVATIRTVLNFFLEKELERESQALERTA